MADQETSQAVIDALKQSAGRHMAAIMAYSTQKEHFQRWGYDHIVGKMKRFEEDEREDLHLLLKRLEYFDEGYDGPVELVKWPRHDYLEIYKIDLAMEQEQAAFENAAIVTCVAASDQGSADVFYENLKGTEKAIANFEKRIRQITKDIGLDMYLAEHMHDD